MSARYTRYRVLNTSFGFTLVELLVVIAILGILVTIGLSSFYSAQTRGRDAQRKSDLKQIASALELFYADYGRYPSSDPVKGVILACPYSAASPDTATPCTWGTTDRSFWDNRTIYMKVVPKDPRTGENYFYRTINVMVNGNQIPTGFQLFASLENTQDINCLPDALGASSCKAPAGLPSGINCGNGAICNFAVTSANTKPTD